jgi:hypothetical protein
MAESNRRTGRYAPHASIAAALAAADTRAGAADVLSGSGLSSGVAGKYSMGGVESDCHDFPPQEPVAAR